MRWKRISQSALALMMAVGGAASAQTGSPDVSDLVMYGFNRESGHLLRYDFAPQTYTNVGQVRIGSSPVQAVDGAAYIPGFHNIYAFWTDPQSELTRLLYINTSTAQATAVGQDLGMGKVSGATTALISGNPQWLSPTTNSMPLAGTVNINPNNSPDNEFVLVTGSGATITRDHLHQNSPVGGDGTFYLGDATNIRFRPKGPGTQNTMTLGGQVFPMHNNTTYLFTGNFNVKVFNDHVHQNGKAMGKWYLQVIDGEAAIQDGGDEETLDTGDQWLVFALQTLKQDEDDPVDFNIVQDVVVPTEQYAVKVQVLGAAISMGSAYEMPVSTRVRIGANSHDLWGNFNTALAGNINDSNNPRTYIFPNTFPAGTPVSVIGRSWAKKNANHTGKNESHWQTYMTVDGSASDSQQLIVLRDGDPVPNISGYLDQGGVVDFVRDYIDPETNKIKLHQNQAIFLYELGTTNMNSPAADFQDLVVLVTLAKSPDALIEDEDIESSDQKPSRLIKVDHRTGGYQQIMTLNRIYECLAWTNGHQFYAVYGDQLWRLDPEAQTETLVGPLTRSKYMGASFAGQNLMAFDNNSNRLAHINHVTAADNASPAMNVGMSNLGTLVFMPRDDDPSTRPLSYD